MGEPAHKPTWWAISEERLLELLRRVEAGEPAELVYASEYANADHTRVAGEGSTD